MGLPKSYQLFGHAVSGAILRWYEHAGREFPWRSIDSSGGLDPWAILVSEIMLQQTQTARVVDLLPRFLERYPDPAACARATNSEMIVAWKGLGYNNRAIRLRDAARQIRDRHEGRVPQDLEDLLALPGIGRYTAEAILCFAFGAQIALLEVNTIRVLSRIFHRCYDASGLLEPRALEHLASGIMPEGRAYDWNQALMDFGATICRAQVPRCRECPLSSHCLSAGSVDSREYYHKAVVQRSREVRLLGRPIRLWRGWVIEKLRTRPTGISILALEEICAQEYDTVATEGDRGWLIPVIEALGRDRLVERSGIVSDGDVSLSVTDTIQLKG